MERKGEKIGWIGGWIGSFLWLGVLSIVWIFSSKILYGIIGLCIFVTAIILIFMLEPSRNPKTQYWKLMLLIYLLLCGSLVYSIWMYGGLKAIGLRWTSFFWIVPLLLPLFTMGTKTWENKE